MPTTKVPQDQDAVKANKRAYYLANREKFIERAKEQYRANPQAGIERATKWNKKHPEERVAITARNYARVKADPERYARMLANWRRYYLRARTTDEGCEAFRRRAREHYESKRGDAAWRSQECERLRKLYASYLEKYRLAGRRHQHNRRSRLEGSYDDADIFALYAIQGGQCAACGKDLDEAGYEVDHVMPVSLGGSNTADNIQLLCMACNRSKGAKHPDDWAARIGKLFI